MEAPKIGMEWLAAALILSVLAGFLGTMEGTQRQMFQEASTPVNELLALIKAKADRWILAGAHGLSS